MHEADEPNASVSLLDAEFLASEHGRDVDSLAMQAEASTGGDASGHCVDSNAWSHLKKWDGLALRVNQESGDRQEMAKRMRHMARTSLKIRDQAPGADGAEPQQKRHERSDFSAAGRYGAPERNTPPRAVMRDHDVDQRRRDQQQLGLERRGASFRVERHFSTGKDRNSWRALLFFVRCV